MGGAPRTVDVDPGALARRAADLVRDGRALVGLAGAPGAGKSTLAGEVLVALEGLGVRAALVPMDGFHLAGRELVRLGRADRKGAPDTFDADGFVALLGRLRAPGQRTVYAPEFRREVEEPVAGAVPVGPDVEVVVTEGNYLLLDHGPWAGVRALLDETWFLEVDDALRVERLVARHVAHGRPRDEARAWVARSDEANARVVAGTRGRADLVVRGR
ncbi:nucleoside/nucleotide kinase family protein [Sanguibacter sp. YZGR15]|uniref:Nucleoside/nucleotide kinase family protein n=1 Tax=Sanguibacter suaedae TaxID=2795737 RepID=A0A934I8V6_9MICO|nr:nucleoside/nucleotide kinase family protein [Sanguibacter suaedae]